jgi:hypothetical protein
LQAAGRPQGKRTVWGYHNLSKVKSVSVDINISRHAKRRAKLYGIPESMVLDIIGGENLTQGEHEIIRRVADFKYPLKIIVSVEKDTATVITNYPLKKGRET